MKNHIVLFALISICSNVNIIAQTYCTPPPFIDGPYTGITNVTLNNLNNNSPDNDGVSNFTSLSPAQLQKGQTFNMSVTTNHNLLGVFSGNLNTVAWIDWNRDGDFLDSDELVYNAHDKYKGTYTESFTVPLTALTGVTRMRVYNDMPAYEGHEEPHPCGYSVYPSNGLGQHGEVEDYSVNVSSATGIVDSDVTIGRLVNVDINGNIHVYLEGNLQSPVMLKLFDINGRLIASETSSAGNTVVVINGSFLQPTSMYILTLQNGESFQHLKVPVNRN